MGKKNTAANNRPAPAPAPIEPTAVEPTVPPAILDAPKPDHKETAGSLGSEPAIASSLADDVRMVVVELPLRRTGQYATRTISGLGFDDAQTLRDLADGLNADRATVRGRVVESPADAIAWLCEQLRK